MLESLLDAMVITNSSCTEDDELDAEAGDGNDYMKVFEWCASDTFEKDMSEASLSRSSSAMSVGSEKSQAGKLERASSMNSTMDRGQCNESLSHQTAAVSRRHNVEHANKIGSLPNSLQVNTEVNKLTHIAFQWNRVIMVTA